MEKKMCEICEKNYVNEDGVCLACARDQMRRLTVKCRGCGSYNTIGREQGDKLDLIDDIMDKGLATMEDLTRNIYGFILRINECVLCKNR